MSTHHNTPYPARRFKAYTRKDIDKLPQLRSLRPGMRTEMKALAEVLPFRVNPYVMEELIDWDAIPEDPMFQLTFPQAGMLAPRDLQRMVQLVERDAPRAEIKATAEEIQERLNPHPAGQLELNVPCFGDEPMPGMQHKYRETVLFFPSQGQTCHAYCTYCFRWAQFVGAEHLRFASRQRDGLVNYVKANPDIESVLFTGGDPLVMKTSLLERYIEPLLDIEHVSSIRLGTKAPAYWPQRFVTDPDADDLLRLFEKVRDRGKLLALMAHYSHARELETPIAREALQRIQQTGAVVRCQAPLVRHVNDSADVWADLWRAQVQFGAVPYYMFVERDTGPRHYFEVPLARAYEIFRDAYSQVSGIARTVRGPSMSATPGKVCVNGIAQIGGEKVFVLGFIQARDARWVNRPFFARYDEKATWLDQLEPAFGQREFFYEPAMRRIGDRTRRQPREVEWPPRPRTLPAESAS
jgi:KamA family protein